MPSRKQNLEIVYQRALDTIAEGDWVTAERILQQLQRVEPNYRDTVKMLRFVQATLAAQRSAASSRVLEELPLPDEPAPLKPAPRPKTRRAAEKPPEAEITPPPAPPSPPPAVKVEKKSQPAEVKSEAKKTSPKKTPREAPPGEVSAPPAQVAAATLGVEPPPPASQPEETPPADQTQIEPAKAAEVEEFLHELEEEEAANLPIEEPPSQPAFRWTRRTITLLVLAGLVVVISLMILGQVFSNSKPLTMQEKRETMAPPSNTIPPTTAVPGAATLVPPTSSGTPTETFTPPPPTDTPTITPTLGIGSTMKSETDDMTMVYVPAGEFLMGPAKIKIYLDAFWIDQTEVTNAMYSRCVEEGACPPPSRETYKNPDYAQHPVMWVNWFQAQAYCHWTNQRLPSEAEWEKAARGTDGRMYPWGNDPPASNLVNICDENCSYIWKDKTVNDGYKKTIPVGTLTYGASPYGAMDMAGNVWEWTADWFDEKAYYVPPTANPSGAQYGRTRVIRGGSWTDLDKYIQTFHRDDLVPQYTLYNIGFRCALTP